MKTKTFIEDETWVAAMKIICEVTPACRVEIAMSGEPTLHPRLCNLIWMAKKISPHSQFNIITNGTALTKGDLTYRDLFSAGANVIYVDMYAPVEQHRELAHASGYQWAELVEAPATMPAGAPSPWMYYGPEVKLIALAKPPEFWAPDRRKRGRLGTWLGNLDWAAASKHGLTKLEAPMVRRCNQPFRHVATKSDGQYVLCCVDFLGESKGRYGSVLEGVEGFKRFWFGKSMQDVRHELRAKNRAAISECSRCDLVFGRADIVWPQSAIDRYWDGTSWKGRTDE
jgi:hypothetical protein